MSSLLTNVLSQNSFWLVNKALVKALDGNYSAAILLSDLIQRREYFANRNELAGDGSFYALSETLEEDLAMGAQMRRRASKDLQDKGFVVIIPRQTTVPSKGLQTVNYYLINDEAVISALSDGKGRGLQNVTTGVTKRDHGGYKTGTQIRIEEEKEEKTKFSQDDIYRKWLSEVPERPDFKACYEELLVLFESLKTSGYSGGDIAPSFKKKVLRRWERSKFPQRHEDWWEKAVGATFGSDIELAVPEVKEEKGVKVTRIDGQISIDAALKMATDDSVIEEMMREYERIRSSGPREGVLDDE